MTRHKGMMVSVVINILDGHVNISTIQGARVHRETAARSHYPWRHSRVLALLHNGHKFYAILCSHHQFSHYNTDTIQSILPPSFEGQNLFHNFITIITIITIIIVTIVTIINIITIIT
jgi:hypothetical protein